MIRTGLALLPILCCCATNTGRTPRNEILLRYGFTTCLSEGGASGEATEQAQAFYRETDLEEPWRYEQITACAKSYVRSRGNQLGRNLVIPYCLDFLRSKKLEAAALGPQRDDLSCAEEGGAPAPRRASPSLD